MRPDKLKDGSERDFSEWKGGVLGDLYEWNSRGAAGVGVGAPATPPGKVG